jgi:hypothetical protein
MSQQFWSSGLLWFVVVCCLVYCNLLQTFANVPASCGSGLLPFVANFVSASTIVILFPNAHVPASWSSGLFWFVVIGCKNIVSVSTIVILFPNVYVPAILELWCVVICGVDCCTGLLQFVVSCVSASTIVIRFPNAHVTASWRSGFL